MISLQGKKDLAALSTTEYDVDEGELRDSDNEETNDDQENSSSDVEDSDEEHRRWLISSFSCVADIL